MINRAWNIKQFHVTEQLSFSKVIPEPCVKSGCMVDPFLTKVAEKTEKSSLLSLLPYVQIVFWSRARFELWMYLAFADRIGKLFLSRS